MKRICVIGGSGRGKSTWIKDFISDVPPENILINDVNGEYGFTYSPLKDFVQKANKVTNKIVIFEEATIFFKGKSASDMTEILVRSRHTKNFIILVFHSLRSIPADIFELIDSFIIFPTVERPDLVEKKYQDYPEIFEAWKELHEAEKEAGTILHKFVKIDQ